MWNFIDKESFEREIEKACSSEIEVYKVELEFPNNIIEISVEESC